MIFLLCNKATAFNRSELISKISGSFSGHEVRPVSVAEGEGQPILLEFDGRIYSIIFMERPLPRNDFADEIGLATLWPLAGPVFDLHKSHVIVAPVGTSEGYEGVLAASKAVTMIAGAIAPLVSASSFIFASSRVFAPIPRLNAAFQSLQTKGELPDDIWVGINFTALANSKLRMFSFGLFDFVGFEFEAEMTKPSAEKLVPKYIGLRKYILINGSVLRQGDTVGVTEQERLEVVFMKKSPVTGLPVMSLRAISAI